jgi:Amt family ammonium transporter
MKFSAWLVFSTIWATVVYFPVAHWVFAFGVPAPTDATGAVTGPVGAIVVGLVAGGICAMAIGIKNKLGFDDALDVVGVHLVGGFVGTVSVGFLATKASTGFVDGLFYGGGASQLGKQVVAAFAVMGYSFVCTLIIALVLKYTIGLRVSEDAEVLGIDQSEHAETAYELTGMSTSSTGAPSYLSAGASKVSL